MSPLEPRRANYRLQRRICSLSIAGLAPSDLLDRDSARRGGVLNEAEDFNLTAKKTSCRRIRPLCAHVFSMGREISVRIRTFRRTPRGFRHPPRLHAADDNIRVVRRFLEALAHGAAPVTPGAGKGTKGSTQTVSVKREVKVRRRYTRQLTELILL